MKTDPALAGEVKGDGIFFACGRRDGHDFVFILPAGILFDDDDMLFIRRPLDSLDVEPFRKIKDGSPIVFLQIDNVAR